MKTEKATLLPQFTDTLYHLNVVSSTPRHVVIYTDFIGSCKSNYNTITTTTPM